MKEEHPLPQELKWVESLTKLMDDSFRIPIFGIRFGLDPIIGLIPGFGEAVSFAISALMVLAMVRHGAGSKLALRMVWNILIDALIGAIPLLGDLFDFVKKANRRNLELLKKSHALGKTHEGSWLMVFFVMIILMAILAGIFILAGYLLTYASQALFN